MKLSELEAEIKTYGRLEVIEAQIQALIELCWQQVGSGDRICRDTLYYLRLPGEIEKCRNKKEREKKCRARNTGTN